MVGGSSPGVKVRVAGPFDGSIRPRAFATAPDVDATRTGLTTGAPSPSTWLFHDGSSGIGDFDIPIGFWALAGIAASEVSIAVTNVMRAARRVQRPTADDALTAPSSTDMCSPPDGAQGPSPPCAACMERNVWEGMG